MAYKKPLSLSKKYTLKDISRAMGVDKTSIIRWEKEGKIPKASRDKHGWRYYDEKKANEVLKSIENFLKSKGKKSNLTKHKSTKANVLKKSKSTEEIITLLLKKPTVRKKVIEKLFEDEKARKQIVRHIIEQLFLY